MMTTIPQIRLVRIGEARKLTHGGAEDGPIEFDLTRVKPMG